MITLAYTVSHLEQISHCLFYVCITSAEDHKDCFMLDFALCTPGSDIITSNGETLIFQPDDERLSVSAKIIDDDIPENEETFPLRLRASVGSLLGQYTSTRIIIMDDDSK